jgi:hypothetical protein
MKNLFRSVMFGAALLAAPAALSVPMAADAAVIRIGIAPPAVRFEARPVAPSPNHVWVSGYWGWAGGKHVWQAGRWIPPRPGHVWVDAHWANEGGQWVFTEGHWVASAVPTGEVVAETAPPPPRVEVVPPESEWPAGQMWIGGHWEYHGRHHEWIPGRYEARRPGHHWEPHRWEQGEGGKWRHGGGEWRHD